MKASKAGFAVLLVKLGPKIFPIFAKAFDSIWGALKPLFGLKSAGLVGSVGLYTYLFTWQMAVALVVFIGIHEYGHLWAMKRCGIKTKGMFFIPGFGAVAVADDKFGSARNEAYTAIMGPIFGFVFFVLPVMLIYWKTGDGLWAAIGAIMAFINLVNLFPIHPLDGGRILKALAYSEKHAASLAITVGVSLVTVGFGLAAGFGLLVYMALVGFWEITTEFGIGKRVKKLLTTFVRIGVAVGMFFLIKYFWAEVNKYWEEDHEGLSMMWSLLRVFWLVLLVVPISAGFGLFLLDVKTKTFDEDLSLFVYPAALVQDFVGGVKEVLALRAEDIKPIENYDWLNKEGKIWYGIGFVVTIAVHVVAILFLGGVPGAELAKELLG